MTIENKVCNIKDMPSLLSFLSEELGWDLPADVSVEEMTYDWTGTDLRLEDKFSGKLKGGVVRSLKPMRIDQPWGIFILEYDGSRIPVTGLRQLLRRFVVKRYQANADMPSFPTTNMLFICLSKNQEFTFAHFFGEKAQHAHLTTFSWSPDEPVRTLCEYNLPALEYNPNWKPDEWLKKWQSAFDVEKVTDKFFEDYVTIFEELQGTLYKHVARQESDKKKVQTWAHDYSLQFLNRIMFLYFIQKKRWLGDNSRFIRYFWDSYRASHQEKDSFFKNWLSVLFFEAFNNEYQNRAEYIKRFGQTVSEALSKAPYLNGGLFLPNELDKSYSFNISDDFFVMLFDEYGGKRPGFFESYNFTISETTPLDQEVAVDPEMIGKVYEKLVNLTFEGVAEEDLRGSAGIFYTPRVEIDLMCRLSLVDHLANHLGENYKASLYETVLAYSKEDKDAADNKLTAENLWEKLDELLRNIAVCDPACGSGSFLIGMLLVLDDLIFRAESHLGNVHTQFDRRKEIIARSLYGVDVMPWAVHVAELRLWLQLVVDTEIKWWEHKAKPMLPNLSFKVRPGDSLVQEVGGINFGLHQAKLDISPKLKGKLTILKGEKLNHYRGDPDVKYKSKEALEQDEFHLFCEILEERMDTLKKKTALKEQEIKDMRTQGAFAGMERPTIQATLDISVKEKERDELAQGLTIAQKALSVLRREGKAPFIWNIAFVEIFEGEKEGFDIVIGNPPYVRQEKIEDPQGVYDKDTYKAKLRQSVYAAYPAFFGYNSATKAVSHKIDGKSDYYVFFYLHGLGLLNARGSFCFITSNSWLDVGYGKDLQEFLLQYCHIKMILDNEKKRSFASADINTTIVLFSSPNPGNAKDTQLERRATFIMFKVPFEEVLSPVIFEEVENAHSSGDLLLFELPSPRGVKTHVGQLARNEYRLRQILQAELLKDDIEFEEDDNSSLSLGQASYHGNKWGAKYLRMPEFLYPLLERESLIPLGKLCELERGKTSGIVDFFILDVDSAERWGIEPAFLQPIVTSTHQIEHLVITQESLEKLIFVCPHSLRELVRKGYTSAVHYVEWGSKQVTRKKGRQTVEEVLWPDVPTVQGHNPEWHCISLKPPGDFIVPRLIRERFFFAANPDGYPDSDMFFHGQFVNKDDALIGPALLNSTITYLMMEIFGRQNIEGRFNIYGPELKPLFVPNPALIDKKMRKQILDAFNLLASREVKKIFLELGFPEPCTNEAHPYCNIDPGNLSLNNVLPDRRELDRLVFGVMGLTANEQLEVYKAIAELVKNRLVKARSV